MIRHLCLLAAAALVAGPAATASAANLLVNGGFEDPITADGPPFVGFWESFSGDGDQDTGPDVARNSTMMPLSGDMSLELAITDTTNTFAGVFQDVPAFAGRDATFSGFHKNPLGAAGEGGSEIRIEWRDSVAGVEVSRTANFAPTVGTDYEEFVLIATAPEGADTARVVYAVQSFGGPATQQLFLDDLSYETIPEPTAALLALLGLAPLARRR